MMILKRIVGIAFTLLALAILFFGLSGSGSEDVAGSLDSPQASGRLLGTMIPVALFGAIGIWLLLNGNSSKTHKKK